MLADKLRMLIAVNFHRDFCSLTRVRCGVMLAPLAPPFSLRLSWRFARALLHRFLTVLERLVSKIVFMVVAIGATRSRVAVSTASAASAASATSAAAGCGPRLVFGAARATVAAMAATVARVMRAAQASLAAPTNKQRRPRIARPRRAQN